MIPCCLLYCSDSDSIPGWDAKDNRLLPVFWSCEPLHNCVIFGNTLDEMIHVMDHFIQCVAKNHTVVDDDCLVCSVNDDSIQWCLLSERKLSFVHTLELTQIMKTAAKSKQEVQVSWLPPFRRSSLNYRQMLQMSQLEQAGMALWMNLATDVRRLIILPCSAQLSVWVVITVVKWSIYAESVSRNLF